MITVTTRLSPENLTARPICFPTTLGDRGVYDQGRRANKNPSKGYLNAFTLKDENAPVSCGEEGGWIMFGRLRPLFDEGGMIPWIQSAECKLERGSIGKKTEMHQTKVFIKYGFIVMKTHLLLLAISQCKVDLEPDANRLDVMLHQYTRDPR